MKTLFNHRRIRSEDLTLDVSETEDNSLNTTPEIAEVRTFSSSTTMDSGAGPIIVFGPGVNQNIIPLPVSSNHHNHGLRSSRSFQHLTLSKSASSQSLKKLNPIAYLRRKSIDTTININSTTTATTVRSGTLRTTPVLSLDECHDFGIIYGTRRHYWGDHYGDRYGDRYGTGYSTEYGTEYTTECAIDVADDLEDISADLHGRKASQLDVTTESSKSGTSQSSKTTVDYHQNDQDTQSTYSFEENTGLGRNRSVNMYKPDATSIARDDERVNYAYLDSEYYIQPASSTFGTHLNGQNHEHMLITDDFSAASSGDADYDACLDEVNAVPEDYYGDQLSFRSNSESSRSSGSLARRKSRTVRKKDQVLTIFSQEVVSDDEESPVTESPVLNSGSIVLAPITES